jgi:hypothetical protein
MHEIPHEDFEKLAGMLVLYVFTAPVISSWPPTSTDDMCGNSKMEAKSCYFKNQMIDFRWDGCTFFHDI